MPNVSEEDLEREDDQWEQLCERSQDISRDPDLERCGITGRSDVSRCWATSNFIARSQIAFEFIVLLFEQALKS